MAGPIEDLLAGLPQAYATLEELLAQSKLGRQHYGPQDSVIASTIAHPVEGAQKAGQWLQDQMMTAGQSPVQPITDPRGAEAGGLAGLNLAGLMQTGGLPFGPKSQGGTLGTILAPGMPDYPESAAAKAAEDLAKGASIRRIWEKYGIKQDSIRPTMAQYKKHKIPTSIVDLLNSELKPNEWYHGTAEQLQGEPRLPLFLTRDKAIAEQIARAKAASFDTPMLYKVALGPDRPYNTTKVYGDDAYRALMEKAGLNADELAASSPNGLKNLIDSIYSEDAQKVLKSKGHSSLDMWDNLDGKEFITKAVIEPGLLKIKNSKALKKANKK